MAAARSRSMPFPIANIDDIVGSKQAANRQKDKESLPRLLSFMEWLKTSQKPSPIRHPIPRTRQAALKSCNQTHPPIWAEPRLLSACICVHRRLNCRPLPQNCIVGPTGPFKSRGLRGRLRRPAVGGHPTEPASTFPWHKADCLKHRIRVIMELYPLIQPRSGRGEFLGCHPPRGFEEATA